jgi:predicted NACHT family NTPase
VDRQYEEDQLKQDQALLKALEDKRRYETYPIEQFKLDKHIQEVRDRITERRTRLAAIALPSQPQTVEALFEAARQRCCAKILHQHSTIQLLNQTEIGVDQLYVDVWLLERSPRTVQPSPEMSATFDLRSDRLGSGNNHNKRKQGITIANDQAKLLISGKPGTGKTTFLKHLAVDCSNDQFQPGLIPVFIELRRIRSPEWKLLDAISAELELDDQQQTQALLQHGKLLILMDGFDEVPTNNLRCTVQEQVLELTQKPQYASNRFILTCRTQIINVPPQGFTSVEVADFNPEQVETFVRNWFCASGETKTAITQRWQIFATATRNSPALQELTKTPMLLSLICWVFQDSGELLSQRALLYRKGIRLLLEKWNDRKNIPGWELGKETYQQLSIEQKETLLTEIAVRKFKNPENFVLFDQADLAKQITQCLSLATVRDGEAVLEAIEAQHGLLVERADELWSFSHLTFQEYFTARHFVQSPDQASLEELATHVTQEHWREVFLLAVEQLPSADELLHLMKQQIDNLLAGDEKLQQFLVWVDEKARSVDVTYKPAAVRALYLKLILRLHVALTKKEEEAIDDIYYQDFGLAYSLDESLEYIFGKAVDDDYAVDLLGELEQAQYYADYTQYYSDHINENDDENIKNLKLKVHKAFQRANDPVRLPPEQISLDINISNDICALKSGQLTIRLYSNKDISAPFREHLKKLPESFWKRFRESIESLGADRDSDEVKEFQTWWNINKNAWTEELMLTVVKKYNIGHDWQFSNVQRENLQQYYEANQLLVDCLNSECDVSRPVREEIEATLLLPISQLPDPP